MADHHTSSKPTSGRTRSRNRRNHHASSSGRSNTNHGGNGAAPLAAAAAAPPPRQPPSSSIVDQVVIAVDEDNSLVYRPPSLDSGGYAVIDTATDSVVAGGSSGERAPNLSPSNYVTQPPRLMQGNLLLTGKISSLFRTQSQQHNHPPPTSKSTSPQPAKAVRKKAVTQARATAASFLRRNNNNDNSRDHDDEVDGHNEVIRGGGEGVQQQKKDGSHQRRQEEIGRKHKQKKQPSSSQTKLDIDKSDKRKKSSRKGSATATTGATAKTAKEVSPMQSLSSASGFSSAHSKRIFYSSHNDDDSDDSYESRLSRSASSRGGGGIIGGGPRSASTNEVSSASVDDDGEPFSSTSDMHDPSSPASSSGNNNNNNNRKTILRYRGFSTSIQSLFLDEALVCASMGCFGLILSNRTEYLLELRNERRGTLSPRSQSSSRSPSDGRRKLPSRVVAYGLILTILLMFSTFIIWGFGTGHGLANDIYQGYDYYDNDNNAYADGYAVDDDQYAAAENNDDQQYGGGNNDDGGGYDDDGANQQNGDGYQQQQNDDANDYDGYNNNNDDGGNYGNNYNNYYNNMNNNVNNNNGYNNGYQNWWNYGDDGGGDYYNNNGYQQQGDDGYAAQGDDNVQQQGDDNAGDDDGGGDNGRRRNRDRRTTSSSGGSSSIRNVHPASGIFKLRDVQENIWNPVWDFILEEWNSYNGTVIDQDDQRRRREQMTYYEMVDDATQQAEYTRQQRDIGANIRTALLFAFLLFLGVLGRRRRMRTRFYLVRARAQEDHLYYASADVGATKRVAFEDTRENQYEGACSHTLCGCYPIDDTPTEEDGDNELGSYEQVEVSDQGITRRKKKPHHQDIVARGFSCFMASCCGALCKCWFQCLSICALAQEAREIRLLLPPRYQRVDFITHQPFHEYQKEVTELRLGWMGKIDRLKGFTPHYNALSRLSRYIVCVGSVCVVAIILTLIFNPRAAFSWQDAVVLCATFLQSFMVLFIVHWIFHKSDLSLDAVIKLFAAGFIIAVPSAFFFEGLLVNIVLFGAWGLYEFCALVMGEAFIEFIFEHWRIVWILGELFNAYVVAAITEELCKYYTFRTVEHPDLVFLTGLNRDQLTQDDNAVDGGLVKYPFGSHQVQLHNRDISDDMSSTKSYRSSDSSTSGRSKRKGKKHRGGKEALLDPISEMDDANFREEAQDVRTYRQKAMAITTGMISVAVGLACAENFLYVFVLGGALATDQGEQHHSGDVIEAWILLFFRSIFPIHALAAAMQSINMIRKFVETSEDSGHRIGVGRIVLPAVILHGTFDAILMGINVFVETAWDKYLEENDGNIVEGEQPYNSLILNVVAWISITTVMIIGFFWYYRENRKQRTRLKHLEDKDMARRAGGGRSPTLTMSGTTNPTFDASSRAWTSVETSASTVSTTEREIELV